MNRHHRLCLEIVRDAGGTNPRLFHGGRHPKIFCDQGLIIFPSTPSGGRWQANSRALVRRIVAQAPM